MTEANKRENIQEELERAVKALEASELLSKHGLLNDAMSRLYYFLLYHVRALLLAKGIEARTHEGALRLFSLHFVKEGNFDPGASHLFSRMMKYREEADYNPSYIFTEGDYQTLRRECAVFAERVLEFLKEGGYR